MTDEEEEQILDDGLRYFMLCLEEEEQLPKHKTAVYLMDKYKFGPITAIHYSNRIQVRYTQIK